MVIFYIYDDIEIYTMPKTIIILFILIVCTSCSQKKQNEMPAPQVSAQMNLPESIQPEKRSTISEGTVMFGAESFDVFSEYTDDVAYIQSTADTDGNPSSLKYRDMLIHLINKQNDTVTFRKVIFREYIHPEDYDIMIMQSVVLNVNSRKGVIPLMISLCQPDTDYCYNFDIHLDNKGKFVITGVSEEVFVMP